MNSPTVRKITGSALAAMLVTGALALSANPLAAQDWDSVEVQTEHVGGNIYALFARGGNIGVSVGDDGVFLIDDQYAPLTAKILAAIGEISDQPVRYLFNTHYHGDHTGGNENLGRSGTLIVAHDKLRARLQQRPVEKSGGWTAEGAAHGLPVVTFNDRLSFHLNGDEARAIHVANAHTDGDSFIHFKGANVIHTGDLMFNGLFPYIDVDAGGNVDGVLEGYDQVLALADDQTRVIPGHGPMATKRELISNRAMIQTVRDRVAALIADGKSLEEIQVAAPAAEYDEAYTWGFINAEKFVTAIHRSLAGD
jgi:glyoxylase-like metal-dependent hydrolase (beta-lactamase superfamily II)